MSQIFFEPENWQFKAVHEQDWLPARVPGCVHKDLERNGIIAEPFYRRNELDQQWIDKQDWEYEGCFQLSEQELNAAGLELVFDGLDTYADVYVNGVPVLSANNMFRTWRINIKPAAKPGTNRLTVYLRSPIAEDLPKLEKLGYHLMANNEQPETGGLGDKRVSMFARKAPYHYGWDWGPRFVTSGIWREVRLAAWSGSRIRDVFIRQDEVTPEMARLTAQVEVEAATSWEGMLRLEADGQLWEQSVELAAGVTVLEFGLKIARPRLWWCRGLGNPELYTFEASLWVDGGRQADASVVTGLRSMKLVRRKDVYGCGFYVELNGVPVFAKGANHIPNDSFITEVTVERYRHEIVSAAEANMNMLRVWGGGIYEQQIFYELCDQYGILVWQDFMFACSMYPGSKEFLDNIALEAEDNIRRLRNHPCIALWCGNNEIDMAWAHYDESGGWGWKQHYSPEQRVMLWADYTAIFNRILPEAVEKFAPGAAYWPSSPLTDETGGISQHSTYLTMGSGDMHYWGVWHAVEVFEEYNRHVGRFMSEYGFQSFPEYRTVRAFAEESDMSLESPVMLAHQRSNNGNDLIKQYMDIYMKEPKDFPAFLVMSQILQAEAVRMAIEAHRRRMPYCMGTLYWQINDCWPVASWAGIDYYGRWKALHYYAKRSYQDLAISIDGTVGGFVNVYLISDLSEPVSALLEISLHDFAGQLLMRTVQPATAAPHISGMVSSLTVSGLLKGHDPASVVLVARLLQDDMVLDCKEHYFAGMKELKLPVPTIRVELIGSGGAGNQYRLECDVLAKQVWLSVEEEGFFTDNFFDLLPGYPKTVEFRPLQPEDGAAPTGRSLTVRSITDLI
ncbi:MAG: beta-galactosidase [Paenibacillaceae bacterium]|jgi:beta-mannosidase|nr:beta-galactosidase [Paenibacillaceae bacterium]